MNTLPRVYQSHYSLYYNSLLPCNCRLNYESLLVDTCQKFVITFRGLLLAGMKRIKFGRQLFPPVYFCRFIKKCKRIQKVQILKNQKKKIYNASIIGAIFSCKIIFRKNVCARSFYQENTKSSNLKN